jgi:2,5-diketo-D-gluconate reductase B
MTEHTVPTVSLLHGAQMPALGLGTSPMNDDDTARAVEHALGLGYRLVDTAENYGNEVGVGRGIRAAGVSRDDVFLTTKFNRKWHSVDGPRQALEASLERLALDYVDLLLIHWPSPDVPLAETLAAMCELREAGRVRHLGVSNFPAALAREALELAPIVCDQVEYHPYLGQPDVLALARERDLMVTAYSPLAQGEVLRDPVLREIGEAHGRSPGQVALRWLLDQPQVGAVPKAASHEHRAANLDVFDFELDDAQRGQIAALARGERTIDP